MISFYKHIDRKSSIKKAKIVLDEYSRLLRILSNASYDIDVKSKIGSSVAFSSYVNADAKLLEAIEKKDRNYAELECYIKSIQTAVNSLSLDKIELINYKYIHNLNLSEIEERYHQDEKGLSERQIRRKLNECYVDFAIAFGIYTYTEKSEE